MYPALKVQYQASRDVAGLEREYRDLQDRNDTLRAEVADLKTPEGVERVARESLGFARAGENVYVVMPSKGATAQASATEGGSTSSPDPITALLDAVFGVRQ
jgi:cell division protein FtsL